MPDILSDYVRRAAEAFMNASRSDDPAEAARIRQKAYKIVELMHDRERALNYTEAGQHR